MDSFEKKNPASYRRKGSSMFTSLIVHAGGTLISAKYVSFYAGSFPHKGVVEQGECLESPKVTRRNVCRCGSFVAFCVFFLQNETRLLFARETHLVCSRLKARPLQKDFEIFTKTTSTALFCFCSLHPGTCEQIQSQIDANQFDTYGVIHLNFDIYVVVLVKSIFDCQACQFDIEMSSSSIAYLKMLLLSVRCGRKCHFCQFDTDCCFRQVDIRIILVNSIYQVSSLANSISECRSCQHHIHSVIPVKLVFEVSFLSIRYLRFHSCQIDIWSCIPVSSVFKPRPN